MAKKKKIILGLGGVVVVAAVVAGVWAARTMDTSRSDVADDTTPLSQFKSTDQAAITRGAYVMRMADCAACHTARDGAFAGGYVFDTPFGTLLSSNITPDAKTGIGSMTERDFFNAVRQGIGNHGLLYSAMPYTSYVKMSDQDMHDLWAYMSTVTPVKNSVDENGGMKFPFNIRLSLLGWNMLFFDNSGFSEDPKQDKVWNRGRYLVDGAAHCAACHSPRNMLGAVKTSAYLQGAKLGTWYAPEITSNPHLGLGNIPVDNIVQYLRGGTDGRAVASGPMAEAVEHSFQYLTDDDLTAIATYVKSVPGSGAKRATPVPADTPAMTWAAQAYEVNCSACHGLKGEGIKGGVPGFAEDPGIMADPTNMIHVMLTGARAAHTHTVQTAAGMPSFAWKLSDQRIADLLTYIRNSWGNSGTAVDPADVAAMRAELKARDPIRTQP